MVITNNLSGGVGVNLNTGTNHVEFFGGYAIGFSRAMVHFGEHWGRQESLGGGFTVNNPVPTGWSSSNTVPINWATSTILLWALASRSLRSRDARFFALLLFLIERRAPSGLLQLASL
jgi:hypothetical protein